MSPPLAPLTQRSSARVRPSQNHFFWVLVAMLAASASASAQPSREELLTAEALFDEGRRLMKDNRLDEACPKLAESYRIDPAGGVLMALALCHERQGKIASAWSEYKQALTLAQRQKRADREQLARERIAELEPKLVRLTIQVPASSRREGLEVRRNGAPQSAAVWGVALPVDPGEQVIEATAPGHTPFRKVVSVTKESLQVEIPALSPSAPAPSAPAPSAAAPPSAAPLATLPPSASSPLTAPTPSPPPSRLPAYVVGGVGVVALGLGSYFGVRASSKLDDSKKVCPGNVCTDPQGRADHDEADRSATIANVAFGLGLVSLGAATYLWLRPPGGGVASTRIDLTPGPRRASLQVSGSF